MAHWKQALNNYCQERHLPAPAYHQENTGSNHSPAWISTVTANYQQFTSNAEHHSTKLSADNSASRVALQQLDITYYNAILNA